MQEDTREIATGLVVDDDETTRILACKALGGPQLRVETAADGSRALEILDGRRIDLVLLDVEMPGLDGFEVCRRIREHPAYAGVPIIMMTGLDDTDAIAHAYELGATDFVTKPVNWLILAQRVNFVLRASQGFEELRSSRERLADALSIARLGGWEIDGVTGQAQFSNEIKRIFGFDPERDDPDTQDLLERIDPEDRRNLLEEIRAGLVEGRGFSFDARILLPDGTQRVLHSQATLRSDPSGRRPALHGISQDVTERKRAEEQVRFLAYHDSLTGLGNQRLFRDQLRQAVDEAKRHRRMLALLFLDLDQFKRVNDTLGHSAGDELLQAVADRLVTSMRATDAVARPGTPEFVTPVSRLGGDEFTVLLRDISQAQDAARVAARLIEGFAEPLRVADHDLVMSPSIGVAVCPYDGDDPESLLTNADAAMYHAKEHGGNNYQFYTASMNEDAARRLTMEGGLRRALSREGLVAHYQPRIGLDGARIVGAEALARWTDAELGVVSPVEFIPVAEESGLILPLGEWILREACTRARAWQAAGLGDLCISVNLSPRQFTDPDLVAMVEKVLTSTGIDPTRLELELTESALIRGQEEAGHVLRGLSDLGIRIALDDFGTGYSSMVYLKRFPVHTLKIDRSFVSEIESSSDDAAIVGAIISMAKELGLNVVAEGVETAGQLAFLQERGCDEIRGFLISPAVPAGEFETLLVSDLTDTLVGAVGPE